MPAGRSAVSLHHHEASLCLFLCCCCCCCCRSSETYQPTNVVQYVTTRQERNGHRYLLFPIIVCLSFPLSPLLFIAPSIRAPTDPWILFLFIIITIICNRMEFFSSSLNIKGDANSLPSPPLSSYFYLSNLLIESLLLLPPESRARQHSLPILFTH